MPISTAWLTAVGRTLKLCSALSLVLFFPLSGAAERAVSAEKTSSRPPNVVLILADDLGWKDLGCYGSKVYRTPNLDKLAEQSMRFTDAYSACSVCSPSRAAILTGKHPARLGLTNWIKGYPDQPDNPLREAEWTKYLDPTEVTLPEKLKPAGYISANVGKWHLGDSKEYWPELQGFDVNVAGHGYGTPPSYFWPYQGNKGGLPELREGGAKGEYLTDRLTSEALGFIQDNRERPFFLYLPHYAVHQPFRAKPDLIAANAERLKGQDVNTTYAAMLESLDQSVGAVMRTLDELGLTENTVLVFTSDNGGLWPEATNNSPLRAGKAHPYEGGVRVPLLVRYPGVVQAGSVCREPVVGTDLFPTLLELTGAARDAGTTTSLDGKSLVPLLKQTGSLNREALYWHYPHYWRKRTVQPHGAVRAGDWKLIEFFEDMRVELYNLADDLGEKNDLAKSQPEKTEELRRKLHDWRTEIGAKMPTRKPGR